MPVFDYDDIVLIPKKCIVSSRKECSTFQKLGKYSFRLPVVPSNMKTVIDENMAEYLATNGYFYIMHRFFDSDIVANMQKTLYFINEMNTKGLYTSISIGVNEIDKVLIFEILRLNLKVDYITIDIAHGHAESVKEMISYIRKHLRIDVFIIAGNVCTPEAVQDLESWGADATKIGIGPGKVCTTKLKTGFGSGGWQLSAVERCSAVSTKPIIADGGIRHNGDIAKSIRFGAAFAMVGSLFARLVDGPGKTVEVDGCLYKEYYGSASIYNPSCGRSNDNLKRNVEGKRILEKIRPDENLESLLREMAEDLQSSISYAGGKTLDALKFVDYVCTRC